MASVVSWGEVLQRIEGRLDAVERRMEDIAAPPRALRPERAAQMLDCTEVEVHRMVKTSQIRSVPIAGRHHIPMSEIVRLTSFASAPTAGPTVRSRRRAHR